MVNEAAVRPTHHPGVTLRLRALVLVLAAGASAWGATAAGAQARPRARDLGIPIGGTAGPLDAITDVAGVEVGHTTLIAGSGKLVVGKAPFAPA